MQLQAALTTLDADLDRLSSFSSFPSGVPLCPLVVQIGNTVLQLLVVVNKINAVTYHVAKPDTEASMRGAQQWACQALGNTGITVRAWDGALRPAAPWVRRGDAARLPSFFREYCAVADGLSVHTPLSLSVVGLQ